MSSSSGPPPLRPHPSQVVTGPGPQQPMGMPRPAMGAPMAYGPAHPMNRPPHQMYPPAPSPSTRPPMGAPPGHAGSMPPGAAPPYYHHPHAAMRSQSGSAIPRVPMPHQQQQQQQQQHHPYMGYPPASMSNHGGPAAPQHPYHHGPPPSNTNHVASSPQLESPNRTQPTLNGTWHSNSHMEHRKKMIEEIKRILLKKDNNPSDQWLRKLPDMTRQLEVQIYRAASSFEEYMDLSTLKVRLQHLAKEIMTQSKSSTTTSTTSSSSSIYPRESEHVRRPSDTGKLHQFSSSHPPAPYTGPNLVMQTSPLQRPTPAHPNNNPSSDKKKLVNMDEINPSLGNSHVTTSTVSTTPTRSTAHSKSLFPPPPPMETQETNDADVRTKYKQQRLLLLYHASQCQAPEGQCTVSEHCTYIKNLWRHMESCKNFECTYSHCVSSRSILQHYNKCDESKCIVCGPVRESVIKHKKQEQSSTTTRIMPQSVVNSMSPSSYHATNRPSEEGRNPGFYPISSYPQPPITSPYSAAMYKDPDRRNEINSYLPTSESNRHSIVQEPSHTLNHNKSYEQTFTSKDRILYKQQRLLLLRHASLCPAKDGECKRTSHCGSMKRLWEHIRTCKQEECPYPHCISSRFVLGHYRKCKDASCEICEPIRKYNRPKENGYHTDPTNMDTTPLREEFCQPATENHPPSKRARYESETNQDGVQSSSEPIHSQALSNSSLSKKSDETSYSLINTFTVEDIQQHIRSLNFELPATLMKDKCLELLKGLQNHEHGWVFNEPVNPEALGIPDYFDVIKHPMDLGTIGKKLEGGAYVTCNDFFLDVRLTFDNALTYNQMGSPVYDWAKILKNKSERDYLLLQKYIQEEMDKSSLLNEKGCVLCGHDMLLYEPPTLFCSGVNCPNQRIGRNRNYYSIGSGSNCYYWCTKCFDDLDSTSKIDLPDIQVTKADLKRKKNDDVIPESWVQCDDCKRWVHYVCSLFNCRQNKDASSKFSCPHCLIKDLKSGKITPLSNAASAEELPRTTLSEYLEDYVRLRIASKYDELAKEKVEYEKISYEEASNVVTSYGKIIIRQVSATDRKLEVRERMRRRYAHKNYPEEFPYRCKCIAVFQTLDGVDVLLFALYLYEHGDNNASPNTRKVYISYLDSVHFMRPRKMRTFIYHEILIGYLDYARKKGFVSAHIWACPPLKGDDYIFYCKPEDQKTPRDTRLRQWYIDMLVECQKRDIVERITNMYDLYIADSSLDATAIPYLEGDYFCGEAENIIKDLEEGKGSKTVVPVKKNKKKKGNETAYSRNSSIASEADDEIDKKSICSEISTIEERDPVILKLGEILKPMKDSFIVAFLKCEVIKREDHNEPNENGEKTESEPHNSEEQSSTNEKDETSAIRSGRIIDDDKEDIDCEILNNRQAFLNLCRINYYQFDQLRRAKYSSMMILWHLHNRDAPKFVQQCSLCKNDLLSGYRYHCSICPDFDICEECFKDSTVARGSCSHDLVAQPVDGDANNSSNKRSQLTQEQRRSRQEMSATHIQLIEHASLCENPNCPSTNCSKMKKYLQHHNECKLSTCKICKNILLLLRMHAVKCSKRECRFPLCMKFRERLRQLAQQQQAMDDRRRQEMNRHYRMGGNTSSDD